MFDAVKLNGSNCVLLCSQNTLYALRATVMQMTKKNNNQQENKMMQKNISEIFITRNKSELDFLFSFRGEKREKGRLKYQAIKCDSILHQTVVTCKRVSITKKMHIKKRGAVFTCYAKDIKLLCDGKKYSSRYYAIRHLWHSISMANIWTVHY